jgi:hypothetical protein
MAHEFAMFISGWCGGCGCFWLLLGWACMLAMVLDIYCINWIWAVKKASNPTSGGFGGFIFCSGLVTTLLRRMRAGRSISPPFLVLTI